MRNKNVVSEELRKVEDALFLQKSKLRSEQAYLKNHNLLMVHEKKEYNHSYVSGKTALINELRDKLDKLTLEKVRLNRELKDIRIYNSIDRNVERYKEFVLLVRERIGDTEVNQMFSSIS